MAAKAAAKGMPTPDAHLQYLTRKFCSQYEALFKSVRSALRKRLPTANELLYEYRDSVVIAYSADDRSIGAVASLAGRLDGLYLYFNHAPQIPDPKKILQGSAKMVRFIQVKSARELAHPDVEAIFAAAIALGEVPMRSEGKGELIIKTIASQKRPRPKAKKK